MKKLELFSKRRCLAAVIALAASSLLHAQRPPELLVWINGDKGYNGLQKVGDAFEKSTGVRVVVQHPESATDKFQAATAAGKGPDIFCWAHDRAGEWAKSGLIVPIRPSKKVFDDIDEFAWNAFRYQGKFWGYPIAVEAIGLIYNKAIVPTPPKSFDEVMALDVELKKQGKSAILWDFNKTFFTWPILAGPGGYVFGRDAKGDYDPSAVGVNSPGAIRGGEVLRKLVQNGHMPKGARYAEMEAGFNRGTVAMMISGPWAWDNAKKSKIDFAVGPIPSIDGKPGKPFVGVIGCMIAAPSKLKDISKEFLEQHMLRPEYLKMIDDDVAIGAPANKAFYAQLAANPLIRATMENAKLGEPIPNIPETGRFWSAMDAALEAITNGLQSPTEALNSAAARMRAK
ncbi:MAG: maltose/maltodextrin ABC transporter substrate-binding protein MalE [Betaproteobacteria bacterium]|nr:MAG: maltose/maltodextrin ABC transporter substrate-binding protein MalE [Betaproteobacteria bacterium]